MLLQMDLNILDALDRAIASPHASHNWLALRSAIGSSWPESVRAHVLQRLANEIAPHPLPQFYRAMLLDILTGDPRWLAEAAALLSAILPHDPDRLSAFFGIAWQRALVHANDLSAYSARLIEIGLPRIASLLDTTMATALAARAPAPEAENPTRSVQRLAVLAPVLLSPAHPPTRMVLDVVEVLGSLGIATGLFSANDAQVPDGVHLLGNGITFTNGSTDLDAWLRTARVPVTVHSCDPAYSVRRRCQDLLPAMAAFNPDAVLFVGLYSPMASLAGQYWPLLGLGTNSAPPMVRTQVWLTARMAHHRQRAATWGGALADQLAYYYPYRCRGNPARRAARGRQTISTTVRLISVGNVLPSRIEGAWGQRMVQLLHQHPQLRWHLVGGKGMVPDCLAALAPGQVHATAHVDDLAPHWHESDIFINPPGSGGGMAVAEAMDAGLPVVSFVDTDGGDKVGADAIASMDEYVALCRALIADPALRRALGSRLAQRFDEQIDLAQAGPPLREALALALHAFHARRS